MDYPIYWVDTFTGRPFRGNPAAVVMLSHWLPAEVMQEIAGENRLSETAFVVPDGEAFDLRWFTPEVEMDLCGHATLAAGHVVLSHDYVPEQSVVFRYAGGKLTVTREEQLYAMDFPSRPGQPVEVTPAIEAALGARPSQLLRARDLVAIFDAPEDVARLEPDLDAVATLDAFAVTATAPGADCDFVSRFFAPRAGVPEDPVTGSAHCTLIPYWAKRLNKRTLFARQVSKRGGEIFCEDRGERVQLKGQVVEYLRGHIRV